MKLQQKCGRLIFEELANFSGGNCFRVLVEMPRVLHKYLLPTPVMRMSMHPHNLYELQQHKYKLMGMNTFQQRWLAKREILGYFGGTVRTTQFKKIFAKYPIPAPIIKEKTVTGDNSIQLSLAFGMMERRLDIILFRALLAPSIFASRSLVTSGHVTVNGEVIRSATVLVKLGDVVQLDANHNQFLYSVPPTVKKIIKAKSEKLETVYEKNAVVDKDNKFAHTMADALINNSVSEEPLSVSRLNKIKKDNDSYYFQPPTYFKPWMYVPNYLEVSYKTNAVVMHRLPNVQYKTIPNSPGFRGGGRPRGKYLSEIPSPFPPKITSLAYEWFIRRCKRKDLKSRRTALNGLYTN